MRLLTFSIMLAAWISVSVTLLNCVHSQKSVAKSDAEAAPTNTPTPVRATKIEPIEGAAAFRNDAGWNIPRLGGNGVEEDSYTAQSNDGRSIHIAIKDQPLKPAPVTDEPFVVIGNSIGKIQLISEREYSVASQPFCYRFQATRVTVDNSNRVTSSGGSVFFFSYYDEDGDGKFETLLLDEKDSTGEVSFSGHPHLPKWILNP